MLFIKIICFIRNLFPNNVLPVHCRIFKFYRPASGGTVKPNEPRAPGATCADGIINIKVTHVYVYLYPIDCCVPFAKAQTL